MVASNLIVPSIGNIRSTALIALRVIKEAYLVPSQEILTKFNLIISLPGTVKGIMMKKKRQNKSTHRKCINTKEKGIFDKKTKTIASRSAKEAIIRLGFNTMERINKKIEISLILGFQE